MPDARHYESDLNLDANAKSVSAATEKVAAPTSYFESLTPGTYDEMMAADGSVRPQYEPVAAFIQRAGLAGSGARFERLQRRIVENGLTLDSFSDPNNIEQPWRLDLIPLVIAEAEWRQLEAAAIQRANLNNAILADLYGKQSLFDQRMLPPQLVFDDPAFLRPMHGHQGADQIMFMAIDCARDASGRWRILDTHAETIAGHGYALANRVVVADVNADLFRACNVVRISTFYQDLAYELARRTGLDAPSIAILAPDPDQETYLSHAYMARYLGYLLLQGSDLRVANEKVFHKTLAGLQQIDLLVRAVEAANTDPLELNPNGFDGPAGLVQAVRANPNLMANALGSAVIENRGLAGFLPESRSGFSARICCCPIRRGFGSATTRADRKFSTTLMPICSARRRSRLRGPDRPNQAANSASLTGPRAKSCSAILNSTARAMLQRCRRRSRRLPHGLPKVSSQNPMRFAFSLPPTKTATRSCRAVWH